MKSLSLHINEALEELYHFTTYNSMISILLSDVLHGSDEICSDGTGPKFISLTRSKISTTGYPHGMTDDKIIRIVFDGKKLQSKYKIRPYDYFGCKGGSSKTLSMKPCWRNPDQFNLDDDTTYRNPNVEAEDRLFLNAGIMGIKDISLYIKEIQVKDGDFNRDQMRELGRMCIDRGVEMKVLPPKKFEFGRS